MAQRSAVRRMMPLIGVGVVVIALAAAVWFGQRSLMYPADRLAVPPAGGTAKRSAGYIRDRWPRPCGSASAITTTPTPMRGIMRRTAERWAMPSLCHSAPRSPLALSRGCPSGVADARAAPGGGHGRDLVAHQVPPRTDLAEVAPVAARDVALEHPRGTGIHPAGEGRVPQDRHAAQRRQQGRRHRRPT